MSNVLDAIMNIIQEGSFEAKRTKDTENSVNQVGDSLEEYIKDAFSNSFNLEKEERDKAMKRCILYHGNSSNPPDIITAGKDRIAIEVKKSDSYKAALQLNSSMPHSKLSSKDTRIKSDCRKILQNEEIDMLYVVGSFVKNQKKIRHLAMVYGSVYCADTSRYEQIDYLVRSKIKELSDILTKTIPTAHLDIESNELGKLKNIDPKGYCDLRVRGMYTYASPYVVFSEEIKARKTEFDMFVVIPNEIFQNMENKELFLEFANKNEDITIENKDYPDPNNNGNFIACQRIVYEKERNNRTNIRATMY